MQCKQCSLLRGRVKIAIGLQTRGKPHSLFQNIQRENLRTNARLPYSTNEQSKAIGAQINGSQ
jgi:hypothetical protein